MARSGRPGAEPGSQGMAVAGRRRGPKRSFVAFAAAVGLGAGTLALIAPTAGVTAAAANGCAPGYVPVTKTVAERAMETRATSTGLTREVRQALDRSSPTSSSLCMPMQHPESPLDLAAGQMQRTLISEAPYGVPAPGAYRAAVQARAAMLPTASSNVGNSTGTW